jgi:hypothetical protein
MNVCKLFGNLWQYTPANKHIGDVCNSDAAPNSPLTQNCIRRWKPDALRGQSVALAEEPIRNICTFIHG